MDNRDFLEQLILKSDPDIDDEGLEMLVTDAEPVLEEWVFTNIISRLSESQRKEIIKITGKKNYSSGEAYEYLSKAIPNYESFMKNVYEEFENTYTVNFKVFNKNKNGNKRPL